MTLNNIFKTHFNLPLQFNLVQQMEKPLGGKIEKLLANQVAVLCCLPLRISQPLDLMLHLVYYLLLTMNRNTRTHGHLG